MSNFNFNIIAMKSIFSAFDFSIEPIAVTDANLEDGVKFIYVNESFLKETGYTKEELIGESPKILQGPKISKKKNGSFFYDKKIIRLVKDKDGVPKYYMAVCHDVTNLKKALADKRK